MALCRLGQFYLVLSLEASIWLGHSVLQKQFLVSINLIFSRLYEHSVYHFPIFTIKSNCFQLISSSVFLQGQSLFLNSSDLVLVVRFISLLYIEGIN